MIIWLSSYPRSGNTLFRIALQSLGLGPTYSLYDDPAFTTLGLRDVVGHRDLPVGKLQSLAQQPEAVFVKTHELPGKDDYPAVYIVRDGRAALVSYAHYLSGIQGEQAPVAQLLGQLASGNYRQTPLWSDHVQAWSWRKPKAVIVCYEALAQDPPGIARRTLEQLGVTLPPAAATRPMPDFSDLRKSSAAFFRKGEAGSWHAEMGPALERQFWRWNRPGMRTAGYETAAERPPIVLDGLPSVTIASLVVALQRFEPIMDGICMPPYFGPTTTSDFDFLMSVAQAIQPRQILEFGTAAGNTVANLCRHTDAHVTTLNAPIDATSGVYRTYDLAPSEIGRVYKEQGYTARVSQIIIDSMDFVPEAHGVPQSYDLVVIDACHDYEYVLNDFLTIRRYVADAGCVLFHDVEPSMHAHLEGAWKACAHLRKAGFDIVHVEGTWWAYWAPLRQVRAIDEELVAQLDYIVERAREKHRVDTRNAARIAAAEEKLAKLRRVPGFRLLQQASSAWSRLRGQR